MAQIDRFEFTGMPEGWVGTKSGSLLICGSGHTIWSDLEQLGLPNRPENAPLPWDVMCINDLVMHFPHRVNYAYSNDHRMLPKWVEARRPRYQILWQGQYISMHTQRVGAGNMVVWPWQGHGTSPHSAVWTGLAMGYDEIILCGIPLDNGPHYFDPPWAKTNFETQVPSDRGENNEEVRYWTDFKKFNVKALSGRLATMLK